MTRRSINRLFTNKLARNSSIFLSKYRKESVIFAQNIQEMYPQHRDNPYFTHQRVIYTHIHPCLHFHHQDFTQLRAVAAPTSCYMPPDLLLLRPHPQSPHPHLARRLLNVSITEVFTLTNVLTEFWTSKKVLNDCSILYLIDWIVVHVIK